jgi:UDP-N-acetylmuramate--alanine ligase
MGAGSIGQVALKTKELQLSKAPQSKGMAAA